MKTEVEPALVPAEHAAKILSISVPSLRRLAAKGLIDKVRVGSQAVRYRVDQLRNFGKPDLEFLQ
jgi:hypothetical protein